MTNNIIYFSAFAKKFENEQPFLIFFEKLNGELLNTDKVDFIKEKINLDFRPKLLSVASIKKVSKYNKLIGEKTLYSVEASLTNGQKTETYNIAMTDEDGTKEIVFSAKK